MKSKIIIIFVIITQLFISSCATIFAPDKQPLVINSDPPEAELYINGVNYGTTPVELRLEPEVAYVIEFRKTGYETEWITVRPKPGAIWVTLDLAAAILLPVIGVAPISVDALTGDWYVLDREVVNAVMKEEK